MSEKLKESISALMDGEADEFELRRALDEVAKDPDLQGAWDRYHLVGARLRGEMHAASAGDLQSRIRRALDEDSADTTDDAVAMVAEMQPRSDQRRIGFGWLSTAVAAGVALVAVLFVTGREPDAPASPELAANAVQIQGPELRLTRTASPGDLRRTNGYILYHVQNRAMNQPGVVPFVKMVTYDQPVAAQPVVTPEQQSVLQTEK